MGRFGYRLNSAIVTFLSRQILHSAGGFYQFYGDWPFGKRYGPRCVSGNIWRSRRRYFYRLLSRSSDHAPDPRRKRITSKKSASFKRRKPLTTTGVTVLLDSSIADEGLGVGSGVSSIDETDDGAPDPYCRMADLKNK